MPSLAELKDKWFVDVSQPGEFPGQKRHPGTQVLAHTDNNRVEWLIDGQKVMADFHTRVKNMIDSSDPTQHQLWIASWRLDAVKLLGKTDPADDAEALILEAAEAGVEVYYLGSGHVGRDGEAQDFGLKLLAAGAQGASDTRFPRWASHHQKFNVFFGPAPEDGVAVVGSVDLASSRWDTPEHAPSNDDRSDGPTHDLSVIVQGPAVHDIGLTFAERWNDPTNRLDRTRPPITTEIPTDFLSTIPPVSGGTHSVQVLRTYPIEDDRGYAWSKHGEFTAWASYLNAIKEAKEYIYIEDQYFYTFNNPPAVEAPPGKLRDSDLVYQLGEALRRGVNVIVLVPDLNDDPAPHYQRHQRRKAAHYLNSIDSPAPVGRFIIVSLRIGNKNPIVHSKLMIVDDELVLVGSANVGQRSMSYDSELHLGIVDSANEFAKQLRVALWQEHLELSDPSSIVDPFAGALALENSALIESGRLCFFPTNDPGSDPCCQKLWMNHFVERYGGPDRS